MNKYDDDDDDDDADVFRGALKLQSSVNVQFCNFSQPVFGLPSYAATFVETPRPRTML